MCPFSQSAFVSGTLNDYAMLLKMSSTPKMFFLPCFEDMEFLQVFY